MNIKHALITFLLLLITTINCLEISQNPQCNYNQKITDKHHDTHFLYLVDKLIDPELLPRVTYLLKSISCEIPVAERILNLVISYTSDQQDFSDKVTSDKLATELYKTVKNSDKKSSLTPCDRFRRALGRAPPPYLEHENVQFIVPIIDKDPGCYLNAFQEEFKDKPGKDNYFFNGILINSKLTDKNNQSIRMVIPDIVSAIDINRESHRGSDSIKKVYDSDSFMIPVEKMLDDILHGRSAHDWEEILTTTILMSSTSSTSSSSSVAPTTTTEISSTVGQNTTILVQKRMAINLETTTTTENSTTTVTQETSTVIQNTTVTENNTTTIASADELVIFDEGDDDDDEIVNITTTTTTVTSSKPLIVPFETQKTIEPSTTATNEEYNEDLEEEAEQLEMASGKGKETDYDDKYRPLEHKKDGIDANMLIYILLLLLLIWCFCLFLCLIWIFNCAKNKKNKIKDEAEQQQQQLPLLEKGPPAPSAPKLSNSTESDEVDDEWKNIKPAKYTDSTVSSNQSKSEMESVKQPAPAAQYAPVEVSEFEDKNDDDMDNRPRHGGYVPAKRTADLHFD